MDCDNGAAYKLHFVLAVEIVNNSEVVVAKPEYIKCPTDPKPIVTAVFLSFILLIAFVLHTVIVITVATSYTLKRYQYIHLLVNLCIVCMLDILLNITVAICYVLTVPWRFGPYMCYFNSFTLNLLSCQMTFAVFVLVIDRICVARKFGPYMGMSKQKIALIVGGTWVMSFLLASPSVCGFILSMPYRNRYSCAVADPKDDYYLITHLVIVLIVPTVLIVAFTAWTAFTFHKSRKKQRKVKGNQSYNYLDQILMTPYYQNEIYPAIFVGLLSIGYVIFWLPFTGLFIVDPMLSQHWNNDTSDSHVILHRWVQISEEGANAFIDDEELSTNMTTNSTKQQLMPEVDETPQYETALIWMRFIYDLIVPMLVFFILKEVRTKSKGVLICLRPNSVDVTSPKPSSPPYLQRNSIFGGTADTADRYSKKSKIKNMLDLRTPVLFATSEGLHIRTVDDTYLGLMDNKPLLGFGKMNNPEPEFTYDLCDVILGYEDLTINEEQYHFGEVQYDKDTNYRRTSGKQPHVEMVDDTLNIIQERDNDADQVFDTTTEFDLEERPEKKAKKVVRFNSALNQRITRPNTSESSILESSVGSSYSNDSGIFADNEIVRDNNPPDTNKAKKKSKIPQSKSRANNRNRGVVHNSARNGYNAPSTSNSPGNKKNPSANSKKSVVKKPRSIKSRHIRSVKSSNEDDES